MAHSPKFRVYGGACSLDVPLFDPRTGDTGKVDTVDSELIFQEVLQPDKIPSFKILDRGGFGGSDV